jgi:hypothetical protein
MHFKTIASLVTMSLLSGGLRAAEAPSAPVVIATPSTPAPTIAAPMASAPAAAPNQIVYTPRLPTAAELTSAAAAQGLGVERIEQSPTQVVAVYKTSNGQTNTVAYQTLPPAGTAAPATNYVTTAPAPTVVYEQPAPRVVYYNDYNDDPFYYPYSPRVWYPPVSVRLGFGFGGHFHGGGSRHWR